MRAIHKQRLEDYLELYCCQIGILPDEVPSLYFKKKEFYDRLKNHSGRTYRKKNYWGKCNWSNRSILVDGYINRNYRQMHHTLVHELVHFRFPWMNHGKKFDFMVKGIIKGARFEPRHTHFFEGYRKRTTKEISGEAILYPAVQ